MYPFRDQYMMYVLADQKSPTIFYSTEETLTSLFNYFLDLKITGDLIKKIEEEYIPFKKEFFCYSDKDIYYMVRYINHYLNFLFISGFIKERIFISQQKYTYYEIKNKQQINLQDIFESEKKVRNYLDKNKTDKYYDLFKLSALTGISPVKFIYIKRDDFNEEKCIFKFTSRNKKDLTVYLKVIPEVKNIIRLLPINKNGLLFNYNPTKAKTLFQLYKTEEKLIVRDFFNFFLVFLFKRDKQQDLHDYLEFFLEADIYPKKIKDIFFMLREEFKNEINII